MPLYCIGDESLLNSSHKTIVKQHLNKWRSLFYVIRWAKRQVNEQPIDLLKFVSIFVVVDVVALNSLAIQWRRFCAGRGRMEKKAKLQKCSYILLKCSSIKLQEWLSGRESSHFFSLSLSKFFESLTTVHSKIYRNLQLVNVL